MIKTYIKESLYVLDYNNNIIDCIFNSEDHTTPGYAYNINLTEGNTGYSDLTFTMPTKIIKDTEDNSVENPKLKFLAPLTKLRYERDVIYVGEEPIIVSIPKSRGDNPEYEEREYRKWDSIEIDCDGNNGSFKMDYIIQPTDKKRSGLEISIDFSAIDYPRFNLSKKKLGLEINDNTITHGEGSLYTKEPVNVPGQVEYIRYTKNGEPQSGNPMKDTSYPLNDSGISNLLKDIEEFTYGVEYTIFYGPITDNGRFNGIFYYKGDYLTLTIFRKNILDMVGDTYFLQGNNNKTIKKVSTSGIENPSAAEAIIYQLNEIGKDGYKGVVTGQDQPEPPEEGWYMWEEPIYEPLDFYTYEGGTYNVGRAYLTPNNPYNYLQYILENTNGAIKKRTDKNCVGIFIDKNDMMEIEPNDNDYALLKTPKDSETYIGNFESIEDIPSGDYDNTSGCSIQNEEGIYSYAYDQLNGTGSKDVSIIDRFNTDIYEKNTDDTAVERGIKVEAMGKDSVDKNTGVLYDVDQVETELARPDQWDKKVQLTTSLSLSDSNCYNAITELVSSFQLYPEFDCEHKEVSLHVFSGKNYGLTYSLGRSLENDSVQLDGEQVITKLHCYGGNDAQGQENINLGAAVRGYISTVNGFYASEEERDEATRVGEIAIVDTALDREHPGIVIGERTVFYGDGSEGVSGTPNGDGTWDCNGRTIDEQTGLTAPWDPNDPEYINCRSPYGTEYIYNLKYPYEKGWITKNQILDLYRSNQKIEILNNFLEPYIDGLARIQELEISSGVDMKANQDKYLALLMSSQNEYYKDPDHPSEGTFYAYPYPTKDMSIKDGVHYIKMLHCYNCNTTKLYSGEGDTCDCENPELETFDILTPVYGDTGYTNADETPMSGQSKGYYYDLIKDLGDSAIVAGQEGISLTSKIEQIIQPKLSGEQYQFNPSGEEGAFTGDKSCHMYIGNGFVVDGINSYSSYLNNQKRMNEYIREVEQLQLKYNDYTAELDKMNNYIQNNYGDYIIEGKYSDSTICYDNILMSKSLEASDKYCVPKRTISSDVIDASGLIEYRRILNETYNDLVRSLHNIGQICPRAGDYITIHDKEMGLYSIPATITKITRVLDNPQTNKIEIDTKYTDEEEFVANIMTATNQVLDNQDIYERTTILNGDGTIDSTALNKSLESGAKDNISYIGTNGSYILDGEGLTLISQENKSNRIKYTTNGIMISNDGGDTGTSLLDNTGIDASLIKRGTLNSNKVQIISGGSEKVILNSNGLIVKEDASKPYLLPTETDAEGFPIGSQEENEESGANNNIKAFIGVDNDNEGLLYLNGQMNITGGSDIAGWRVTSNSIRKGTGANSVVLSSDDSNEYRIGAGGDTPLTAPFSVKSDGALHSASGTIGGWTIGSNKLSASNENVVLRSSKDPEDESSIYQVINANGNFIVDNEGKLTASNAEITGKITTDDLTATSGTIGGGTITENGLGGTGTGQTSGTITAGTISGSAISGGSINISTTGGGYLRAGNIPGESNTKNVVVSGLTINTKDGINFRGIRGFDLSNDGNNGDFSGGNLTSFPSAQATGDDGYRLSNGYGLQLKTVSGDRVKSTCLTGNSSNPIALYYGNGDGGIRFTTAGNISLYSSNLYVNNGSSGSLRGYTGPASSIPSNAKYINGILCIPN